MMQRWRELAAAHGPRILKLAQRVFFAAAFVTIAIFLVLHREELARLLTPAVFVRCVGCALVLALAHPVIATSLFLLQRHFGVSVSLATSLGIYMRRIPARYLPGGIWHSAARYADLKFGEGADGATLRRMFLVEVALVATTGLVASGAGIWLTQSGSRVHGIAVVQSAVGAAVVLAAWLFVRRGRWLRLAAAAALYAVAWCAAATAFVLIASALADAAQAGDCAPGALGASYLVAAVQGYLAIFAPQGWGVAETSFAVFNSCGLALSTVLGAFVLYRVSSIGGDTIGYLAWALLARRVQRRPVPPTRAD